MKATSIPPPASICASASAADAVPHCGASTPIILDEGHRLVRTAQSFFRAVRIFLSDMMDSSAFHEISSDREISIIFTSNGPLIYRWKSNKEKPRKEEF
jgi:hypothetical protein